MVPPRYWPVFIPHCKHKSGILWLVERAVICYFMPTEHFAHNPMDFFKKNHILGMLLSVSRKTTELNEQQGWRYFWLLTLKLSDGKSSTYG